MKENQNTLAVINGEKLMDMDFPTTKFCVETLLPQGVCMLGGAPKVGKSWLVLDLCLRVAKGEPLWGLSTRQGTVLYLCLEDSMRRIRERLWKITDEAPNNIHFGTEAKTINEGLRDQLRAFVHEHPDTILIVIDTFQIIRNNNQDISYANEYEEMRMLKQLADEMNLTILLVHHLRKQFDRDPLNMLSGTTGISGAVDAVFVLEKPARGGNSAVLRCTGRDIVDRCLELQLSKENCIWNRIFDSFAEPELLLPEPMREFVGFMKQRKYFRGGNTELVNAFNVYSGRSLIAKSLKQQMNNHQRQLEENGITFRSYTEKPNRVVEIVYHEPEIDNRNARNASNE